MERASQQTAMQECTATVSVPKQRKLNSRFYGAILAIGAASNSKQKENGNIAQRIAAKGHTAEEKAERIQNSRICQLPK